MAKRREWVCPRCGLVVAEEPDGKVKGYELTCPRCRHTHTLEATPPKSGAAKTDSQRG